MLSVFQIFRSWRQKSAFRKSCSCTSNPLENNWDNVEEIYVGCDTTNGRYGDVTARICPYCKFIWLHYHVTYEGFSRSGRWYRGRTPEKQLSVIKPEEAVAWLEKSNPCFYGGSYYETDGRFLESAKGQIHVDL